MQGEKNVLFRWTLISLSFSFVNYTRFFSKRVWTQTENTFHERTGKQLFTKRGLIKK